jgi:hypothetical protein
MSRFANKYSVVEIDSNSYKYVREKDNMLFVGSELDTNFDDNIIYSQILNHESLYRTMWRLKNNIKEYCIIYDLLISFIINLCLTAIFLIYTIYVSTYSSKPEFNLFCYLWIAKNIYFTWKIYSLFKFMSVIHYIENKTNFVSQLFQNKCYFAFMGSTLTNKYRIHYIMYIVSYILNANICLYCFNTSDYYFVYRCLSFGYSILLCLKIYYYRYDLIFLFAILTMRIKSFFN